MTIGPRPLFGGTCPVNPRRQTDAAPEVDPEMGNTSRTDTRSKRRSPTSDHPRMSRSRSRDRRRRRTPSPDSIDSDAAALIEAVVLKVQELGSRFESTLQEREKHNRRFDFLWDEQVMHDTRGVDLAHIAHPAFWAPLLPQAAWPPSCCPSTRFRRRGQAPRIVRARVADDAERGLFWPVPATRRKIRRTSGSAKGSWVGSPVAGSRPCSGP